MTRCELAMPPILKTSQGDKRHRNDAFWHLVKKMNSGLDSFSHSWF